jgi:exopolysaccharide biosynthesis protein
VLSYGGLNLPASLTALRVGTEVSLTTHWRSAHGASGPELDAAHHIVNGAGLLRQEGRVITDWTDEDLSVPGFTDARHPRTLVGQDDRGAVWLAAVDGRQPDYSVGMTFGDLQRLATRLGLTDALNLDGGGSTTMVVRDIVVNRPSDPGGAREVADALIVTPR